MARRPSTVSLSSVGSGSGLSKLVQLPPLPPLISRSSSKSLPNGSPMASRQVSVNPQLELGRSGEAWDPDELFAKHTVAEVRAIQQRLRADADAKQEELRLMVGERYRDLLQASTSIISLAGSSNRVVDALQVMRHTTSSIQGAQSPKHSGSKQGDTQLQSLQSLAAHLKLLLDSSEHLWRLIEKKQYLQAAWLFLLSRVVHRSLHRHGADEDEDVGWRNLEIDIPEQFPLVQRQWETISQFRTQIAHKATLSLREATLSSPEVCAILLALHLLESRPFAETLNTFLLQRSRCLTTALARQKDRLTSGNGHALNPLPARSVPQEQRSRAIVVRDVKQKLKTALDIVSRTLGASRTVFISEAEHDPLMRRVLIHIQSPTSTTTDELPAEVRLTSQTLLSTLPSSNHFLLLPATIRAYKPYVDVDSLSPQKEARFSASLTEWFENTMETVQSSISSWLLELTTIRELWATRAWCTKWLDADENLAANERAFINSTVDLICRRRAVELWKTILSSIETAFCEHLASALSEMGGSTGQASLDAQPVRYLLQSPPISLSSPSGLNAAVPFQKYSSDLQHQIAGRTPLLQDVLQAVESRVQILRDDLSTMHGQDEGTRDLAAQLVEDYRTDADVLCQTICNTLQTSLPNSEDMTEFSLRQALFIARLADDLSSSTRIITSIGGSPHAADEFRTRLEAIHSTVVEQWQRHVARKAADDYYSSTDCDSTEHSVHAPSNKPSAAIINAVLSLSTHVQELGSLLNPSRIEQRAGSLLEAFATHLLEHCETTPSSTVLANRDLAQDLVVLHVLLAARGTTFSPIASRLQQEASRILGEVEFDGVHTEMTTAVTKMRLLFGLLLPTQATFEEAIKSEGSSKAIANFVGTQNQSAVELVKPSARFGLLLVGSIPR